MNREFDNHLSARSGALSVSKIREIAELGFDQPNVIPLWFGEGAWPSAENIVSSAVASLEAGDHFYQPNSGKMVLREEVVSYTNRIYNASIDVSNVTVTASGTQGLALVAQAIISPGDRVVVLEPGWPNISQTFEISGANIVTETLEVKDGHWHLDMSQLLSALTPETQAVVLNSPNNPTGWVMSIEEQSTLLTHCRKYGIWIVSDDVYSRLYANGSAAPSFLSITNPDDLFISINSFSKAWSMTGWRLGWLIAPAQLESVLAMLTEFNIACPPGFIQQAGVVALRDGEDRLQALQDQLGLGYVLAASRLRNIRRVKFIESAGAFYCFFSVAGASDSMVLARNILQETGVGLAPGIAFGPAGEGYLRLCYAQPEDVLIEAFDRLEAFID